MTSAKLNPSTGSHRQSAGASFLGGNWVSKLPAVIGIHLVTGLKVSKSNGLLLGNYSPECNKLLIHGLENSLRFFVYSSIGCTYAHYSVIADDKLFTLTSLVKTWTPQQKVQCVLWLTEFKSVTHVQRRVRTKWNVDPPTSKSIHQWERTLKETGGLVSQTSKCP
ncbi:uncharacterized protein TNCV_4671941 [Trichonephila clavipes]|nr:uncharacterized protein TNCV_4671941 [Trichonephila clavipes]